MTEAEWGAIAREIQRYWPQRKIEAETFALWFRDLADLPAEQVAAALAATSRDGREFAPNGGQVRRKLETMATADAPDHGDAWALAQRAVGKFGCPLPTSEGEALTWIAERSELVAEAVRRYGYRDLALTQTEALGTARAQFREIFNGLRRRAEHAGRYAGLPAVTPRRLAPRSMGEVVRESAAQLEPGE